MDQDKVNETQPALDNSQGVGFENKTEDKMLMRYIRIFLLVIIIVGLGLLATQRIWVPKLVSNIVDGEVSQSVGGIPVSSQTDPQYSGLEPAPGSAGVVDSLARCKEIEDPQLKSNCYQEVRAQEEAKSNYPAGVHVLARSNSEVVDGDLRECKKVENTTSKLVCYQEAQSPNASSDTGVNLVLFDPTTRERRILLNGYYYSLGFLGSNGNKFYSFISGPVDGVSSSGIYLTDLNKPQPVRIGINGSGRVSPNLKYYTTNADTSSKDGKRYCYAASKHGDTEAASAIKILDFSTGEVKTILEDKTKVYIPKGWTPDSSTVIYSSFDVSGVDMDGCPELVNEKEVKIKI